MSDWNEVIAESKRLEEAASKIQSVSNISQEEIERLTTGYHTWYGTCLSMLPDDLKNKFRFSFEGDGYAAPCIQKFLQAPLDRKKTYPGGRRGKPIYSWQYPFQVYFSNPLQSQRQILIEASLRQPLIQPAQSDTKKTPIEKGNEELNRTQPRKVTQGLTRKHWVPIVLFLFALGAILDVGAIIFSLPTLVTILGSISNFSAGAFAFLQWINPLPPITEESAADLVSTMEQPLHIRLWRNPKMRIGILIVIVLIVVIGPLIYAYLPHPVPIPNTSYNGILKFQDALSQNNTDFSWMEITAKNSPEDYCKFIGAGYHASVTGNGSGNLARFCLAQKPDFSNFAFTIEMTVFKSNPNAIDNSGGGVLFREGGPGPGYVFYISQFGLGTLFVLSPPGQGIPPLVQHQVPGVQFGDKTFFIEVVALGGQIQIFVNNHLFTNISDLSSSHGKIGVFAQSLEGQTEVQFSSIEVWTL